MPNAQRLDRLCVDWVSLQDGQKQHSLPWGLLHRTCRLLRRNRQTALAEPQWYYRAFQPSDNRVPGHR